MWQLDKLAESKRLYQIISIIPLHGVTDMFCPDGQYQARQVLTLEQLIPLLGRIYRWHQPFNVIVATNPIKLETMMIYMN